MTARRAFSALELIACLGVVAVLLALTLPTIAGSTGARRMLASGDNLRVIGAAHAIYAADWNGRQLTFVDDFISGYASNCVAFFRYLDERGVEHPPVALGWGRDWEPDPPRWFAYRTGSNCANAVLTLPVNFRAPLPFFGSFRFGNAEQFHRYLGGRFYDEVFYAPRDTVVIDAIDRVGCFDAPDEYCRFADLCREGIGDIPAWSSYVLSPAAMFDPAVMAHDDPDDPGFNGWRDPWDLVDGFRSPAFAQTLYPSLKTHVIEHHWLQNTAEVCNPGFSGFYRDEKGECCEPYYFNHGFASSPVALFYDGHVAEASAADAVEDDRRVREQNHPNWGLWSKDTPWGADGYLIEYGYDQAETSFHVLTTDGILGRDILEPGGVRPRPDRPAGHPVLGRAPRKAFGDPTALELISWSD